MKTPLVSQTVDDAINVWTFFRGLESSQLLDRNTLEALRIEFPQNLKKLKTELVERSLLTPFQIERVSEGQPYGLRIGPYCILDELGRGGFGLVYLAKHRLMDRVVALKVILAELVNDQDIRNLFLREVIATTRLVHPNIALAYDAGEADGTLYFAMEYVPGISLERHIIEKGKLEVPIACGIAIQVAHALQYAHDKGMVHRDIKPGNIILAVAEAGPHDDSTPKIGTTFHVKVIDFGLARLHPRGTAPTQTICSQGGMLGTPAFMAPEQARDYHNTDIRSDLFSLGCTLYYALSGRLPFDGINTRDTVAMVLEQEPIPLSMHCPELPSTVLELVKRLMAKNPAQRYQTPVEAADALLYAVWSHYASSATPAIAQEKSAKCNRAGNVAPVPLVVSRECKIIRTPSEPDLAGISIRELWEQWCEIVQKCATGEAIDLSEREYRLVHRSLLSLLQANEPADLSDTLCESLRSLVEPWLSLETLVRLDRKMQRNLWHSCQEASRALEVPKRQSFVSLMIFVLVLVVSVSVVLAVYF